MPKLADEVIDLLKDPESIKIVATIDADGVPHAVVKGSLTAIDGETIAFSEGLETSVSNKNLVRSIWFNGKVAVNVTKGLVSYQIKGRPYKCLIAGPIFKEFFLRAREKRGPDADIATVWLITVEEIRNESPRLRREEEETKRPYFNRHLDRESIVKRG